jgi:hypothetical protein
VAKVVVTVVEEEEEVEVVVPEVEAEEGTRETAECHLRK